jgi:hypothetical protein
MISNHQFQYLHTGQQQDTLHINYTEHLVNHISQTFPKQKKMKVSPKENKKKKSSDQKILHVSKANATTSEINRDLIQEG